MIPKVEISPEEIQDKRDKKVNIRRTEPTDALTDTIMLGINSCLSERKRPFRSANALPEIITLQKRFRDDAWANIIEGDNLKLNIGSGRKSYEGFLNLDRVPLENTDIIWDLEMPLPFRTNSVSEVICEHILEHIVNFIPLLEELYRVCKPKAKIYVMVPYFRYEAAYRDPTHVRFFTEHSFDYFQDGVEFSHYSDIRFDVKKVELRTTFKSSVKNLHKKIIKFIPFKKFLNIFLWNIYTEIYFELEVVK
jgi:SAM-dependent methyltransferase